MSKFINVKFLYGSLLPTLYPDCETRINIDHIIAYQEIIDDSSNRYVNIHLAWGSTSAVMAISSSMNELSAKIKAAQNS